MSENLLLVIGSQFGEEKKEKFTDLLSNQYDYVVRYQGCGNANRLFNFNNKLFKLNLIPSAIFNPRNRIVLSQGVFINPNVLLEELNILNNNQVLTNNLYISDKSHIIFNFHIEMDKLLGELNGENKNEIVYKGINSCGSDKVLKLGIRICDLFDFNLLLQKIQKNLQFKNVLFIKYGKQIFNPYSVAKQYFELGQKIKPFIINTSALLNYAYDRKNKILFEADDSIMLDVDYGNYPYISADNAVVSVASGTGIAINKFKRILGVIKAYSVKNDNSCFLTEIQNQGLLSLIREKRREYNADVKQLKRIGWLDLFLLKYVVSVSGMNEIAITSISELTNVGKLKACIGYQKNGKNLNYMPSALEELKKCEPIYTEFDGWNQDVSNLKSYDDLPDNLKKYILYIESFLKVKVRFISVGSHQSQTIIKNN
ncbi:MAG: adenylosuccinate synthetase [Malacoplasma sp.]|nr:adenylosuccinate synthetase [Malacoplasma sp.]